MSEPKTPSQKTAEQRAARRRFIKVAGAGALAVPVMETITGKDLLTVSAQAQTGAPQGFDGAMTGTIDLPASPGANRRRVWR